MWRKLIVLAAVMIPSIGLINPAQAGESHPAGVAGGPAYVRLPPISFSVIGPDNKINKEVSIMADLELGKDKNEQMFEPFRRNLLNAFVIALTGMYEDDNPTGQVSSDEMKQKLLDAATQVTGPDFVHQVLLISVGERSRQ